MAKQKIRGLSASFLEASAGESSVAGSGEAAGSSGEPLRPVVQTVKVPPDVFIRLKTLGARERRSSQDILLSALREYLDRAQHPQEEQHQKTA